MQYSPELQPFGHAAHSPEHLREIEASELSPGHRLRLPDGETTAQILEVDAVVDDYGRPALYFIALDNSTNLRVAHGTSVSIAVPRPSRPADLLFAGPTAGDVAVGDVAVGDVAATDVAAGNGADASLRTGESAEERGIAEHEIPDDADGGAGGSVAEPSWAELALHVPDVPERKATTITLDTGDVVVVPGKARPGTSTPSAALRLIPKLEGTPEDLIRHIDAVHPGRSAVHQLSERLARGINPKSGACLQDLRDLAYELFVGQNDAENALKVADLLAVIPFDGNPGRWSSVESGLALAAHLARERGQGERAAAYSELLRGPETAEADPFRAQMAARVRQRTLNEPNLYDKEVSRADEAGDDAEERNWRVLRLATLLHLRAHGGSEAFDDAELDRRIRIELDAVGR
ncbi:DUF6707 family protein [Sinomonas sp. ASV322]|uniref:DUF6707 family protein n=1 Tax=Sinomonas sp. ASV322 TaxID=3041920 RepID=UPI0027DAD15A|nr:DUF6707 family protein [Sinomonas sp. ASV322]MDQ4503000.1 hypothetical protein [Sinomonas sp. ASV322]